MKLIKNSRVKLKVVDKSDKELKLPRSCGAVQNLLRIQILYSCPEKIVFLYSPKTNTSLIDRF